MLPNTHLVFYGEDLEMRGLYLDSLDKINLAEDPDHKVQFKPDHRYIVVWNDDAQNDDEQPYQIIKNHHHIHFGPRGENFFDFTKCPYLTTRDGIIFKFIYKRYEYCNTWLDEQQYESMSKCIDSIKLKLRNASLDSGISKRSGNRWYRLSFEKLKDAGTDIRDFCEKPSYVKPQQDIKYIERVRDRDRIISAFEYLINKPVGTIFGFDYETHGGWPMEDEGFKPVGLGISCCDEEAVGVYFDIQWMLEVATGDEYDVFIEYFNKFLDKFEDAVTYNSFFEMRVTYLLTKRLCLFTEGAAINKCEGRVYKRFSLKYTVQCVLGIKSWDDDFDLLTGELLPSLWSWNEDINDYDWKLVSDGYNYIETGEVDLDSGDPIMKEVPNDYKHNPVWDEICKLFPEEVSEFESLIERHYGDEFACIPSNIQAQYCCRDSYYTGLLKIEGLKKFSQLCWDTYNNNLRLEAVLHLTGFFLNEDLRLKMELQCLWLEVYGKLNTTRWVLAEKVKWFSKLNIPEIPYVTKLIQMGYDPCDSKSIIMSHLSDTSETGLDEDKLLPLLGKEVLEVYKDYIRKYVYRIDESFKRSRKVFSLINEELENIYHPEYGDNYCKYTIDDVEYKVDLNYDLLMEYYQTFANYKIIKELCEQVKFSEIEKLVMPQLGTPNLPSKLYSTVDDVARSKILDHGWGFLELEDIKDEYTLDDVLDYCDEAFNYKSVKNSPYFKFMVFHKFRSIVYYSNVTDYEPIPFGTTVPLTDELIAQAREKEFTLEWIDRRAPEILNEDLDRLKSTNGYKLYELHGDPTYLLYYGLIDCSWRNPDTGKNESLFQNTPTGERDKEGNMIYGWSHDVDEWHSTVSDEFINWYDFMMKFIGQWCLSDEDKSKFYKSLDDIDIEGDTVECLAKLGFCYVSAKKYDKVLGTYLRGIHFYEHNYNNQYFDENGVTPNRYEEKGIHKCYLPYAANSKKSKRWSSGYHTIPSKSEMKRLIVAPPGYLISYFDISGAEIRTISFMAQDEFMMQCYHDNKDPYITMAQFTYPEKKDDMDFLKSMRGVFKQVLLGSLYGMGAQKMADLAEIELELAEKVIHDLWERCPGLKKFVEEKSRWAEEHPGYVQSALGDVLELDDSDGEDRLARLGINQFIQNYSSVSLADGFYNNIEKSIHYSDEKLNNKDFVLRPLGVVHDSCQIYFPTKYLFEMSEYYTRNLSEYLYNIHKILYAFDLEVGINYFDMLELKQLDPTHIEFKGNHVSVFGMLKKLTDDGLGFRVTKVQKIIKGQDPIELPIHSNLDFGDEFKPKLYNSLIEQFYDYGCYAKFNVDKSSYKVTIEKV